MNILSRFLNIFVQGTATVGDVAILDGMTAPDVIAGYARIYVDVADGDLKIKFADGTVKTITTDT